MTDKKAVEQAVKDAIEKAKDKRAIQKGRETKAAIRKGVNDAAKKQGDL